MLAFSRQLPVATTAPLNGLMAGADKVNLTSFVTNQIVNGQGLDYSTGDGFLADGNVGLTAKLDAATTGSSGLAKASAGLRSLIDILNTAGFDSSVVSSGVLTIYAIPWNNAGVAGDVTIWNANSPLKFRLLWMVAQVTTAVASSTIQLRSASGGGGNAMTNALSCASAVLVTSTQSAITLANQTVPVNGSMFLRMSAHTFAGVAYALALRQL